MECLLGLVYYIHHLIYSSKQKKKKKWVGHLILADKEMEVPRGLIRSGAQ